MFRQQFVGDQCVVRNAHEHQALHNHIVMNSVNYETGKKVPPDCAGTEAGQGLLQRALYANGLSVTESRLTRSIFLQGKKSCRKIS
jgi:hypothetical protein